MSQNQQPVQQMNTNSVYYSSADMSAANSGPQMALQGQDTNMVGMFEESMLERYDEIHVAEIPADDEDDEGLPDPIDNAPTKAPTTGAGAGPLPQSFGTQSTQAAGSTLTGFTKRRNWAQRVVEELKDFLHILTPDGRIIYISENSKEITGYPPEELEGKFIVDFIHPDDSGIFVREFNESIASGHPLRFFYRFRKQGGEFTIFESHGHPHFTTEATPFGPNPTAGICGGFFMMARPYPTKTAALLDSFLEHKIENERLKKKIEALRKEEEDEAIEYQKQWSRQQEGSTETPEDTESTPHGSSLVTGMSTADQLAMPPPAKPTAINTALTRQNLEDATAGNRPEGMDDKMARYEGVNHYETIELLTGLRYQEGERSQGISTGDPQPALIRGDAGIVLPLDKESRGGDKKKKLKVTEEFVCTDCGTLDSPEWRKGPSGRKTLCNACGLRWAKKEKKKSGPSPVAGTPGGNTLGVPLAGTAVSSTT